MAYSRTLSTSGSVGCKTELFNLLNLFSKDYDDVDSQGG